MTGEILFMNSEHKKLTERDGGLINNWYIACLSKELHDQPLQRIIYDTPLVLFRGKDGYVNCLLDRCLHRHALLSEGRVIDNCLVCPYHGWSYAKDGEVVAIPSEGNSVQQNLKGQAFQAIEREGVIWVWMGSEPPSAEPTWNFPYFDQKGWKHYFMITDFKNEVTNLVENFMDVPHTVYVHQGWFRDRVAKSIPMSVETKDGRVLVTYDQDQDEFSWVAKKILNPKNKPMKHTDCFIFPNLTRVDYTFGKDSHFIINSQCTPVSTLSSRVYTYIAYKIPLFKNLFNPIIRFYTRQVIEQDVDIMRNQGTSLEMNPKTNFRSTPADEVHISIERLRHFGISGKSDWRTFEKTSHTQFWI